MRVALVLLVLLLAGCGPPHELGKQAEEVESVAAQGSLLAHDAAEGSTTATFAREHATALRKLLGKLRPAIEDEGLGRLAARTDAALRRLASDPGDEAEAGRLERQLASLAENAGKLAA